MPGKPLVGAEGGAAAHDRMGGLSGFGGLVAKTETDRFAAAKPTELQIAAQPHNAKLSEQTDSS